jgi:hypothetical protein
MPDTFIKIASVTVGSGGAASIDFSSIPSTYTDLCVKLSARSASTSGATWHWVKILINGQSTTYSYLQLFGNGSSAGSGSGTGALSAYATDSTATSNTFSNSETYFPNYAGSTQKSYSNDAVTENNGTAALASFFATLHTGTAAINQLTLSLETGNFAQYSTATLYGIKNS